MSGIPPTRLADDAAAAAERLDDDAARAPPSATAGRAPSPRRAHARPPPSAATRVQRVCAGQLGDESLGDLAQRARARRRASARVRARAAPRAATPPRARRRPCSARARRRRARPGARGAARAASRNGSRSMNAANSAVGSTPASRTRPDVYAGDRAHAVRARAARSGERIGERARAPCAAASRRAASPARRSPWMSAITVVGTRASAAPEEHERGLLRALREDGVGPEAPQLARDAERQQRVERGAVERARPNRPHEREARGRSPLPPPRAREHAHVELGRRARRTSAASDGDERQRVARPADHEQLPLHRRAASRELRPRCAVKTASSE